MADTLGLSSPWAIYASKVEKLFEYDDEVSVVSNVDTDAGDLFIKLYVDNPAKAESLAKLMKPEVTFGNVTVKVSVIPSNDTMTTEQVFSTAFNGNLAFCGTITAEIPGGTVSYAVFEPECAQFFSDDMSSAFGVTTMTYEQIAKDVLGEDNGIFICSDAIDDE